MQEKWCETMLTNRMEWKRELFSTCHKIQECETKLTKQKNDAKQASKNTALKPSTFCHLPCPQQGLFCGGLLVLVMNKIIDGPVLRKL